MNRIPLGEMNDSSETRGSDPRVGDFVSREILTAEHQESVAKVLARCRQSPMACLRVDSIFILDEEGVYLGVVTAELLTSAEPDTLMSKLLQPVPAVLADADEETAANLALQYDLSTVPVKDEDGKLLGAVPPKTLLKILHHAHIEDMNRFVGIWKNNSDQALSAIEGNPLGRAWHRLPWLLVGAFGSVLATFLMADFEQELKTYVAVAFFIPGLVYLADAVGTQSEAIAVRGLSFSQSSLIRLWLGEIYTGLLLGFFLAGMIFPLIWLAFGIKLAGAVSIALIFASSLATSIGLLFPWILSKLDKDPAFGSGPVATIVQDIFSLGVYLLTVRWLLS